MAKQNTLQEVKDRMKQMQDSKAAQLAEISQKQEEARSKIEAAALAMKDATERMDVDGYEEAKTAKRKAQTALDMYTGRYNQIKAQEYINEAESDKVVDSLLAYENQLAEDFKAAIAVHLKQLAKLHEEYTAAVQDTENTLTAWQRDIHANYNTRGNGAYYDGLTGQHTHRSPSPVPVHRMAYTGCSEAARLGEYLKKDASLCKERGEE